MVGMVGVDGELAAIISVELRLQGGDGLDVGRREPDRAAPADVKDQTLE